jgi:hypothetical protein
MIFSVFSIFLTVILGASAALLGLIEGMADFAASSLDYFAAIISAAAFVFFISYGTNPSAKT